MPVASLRVLETANDSRNSCCSFKTLEEFETSLVWGEEMSCLSQFILFFRCRESYRIVRFEIDGLFLQISGSPSAVYSQEEAALLPFSIFPVS